MAADDDKDRPKTPPKNPWGQKPADDKPSGPWRPQGGNNNNPPEFDELLRRARANLQRSFGGGPGSGKYALGVVAVIAALWLLSGFYLVSPGENAVITRFGQWTKTQKDPGLGYRLPWPIESANILNVTVDRRIQIGFADGGGSARGAGGKRDIPEESLMLTTDANIIDIDLVIFWNIENAKDYLFNVKDQEQTIKRVAESALREVVGQTDLQPIITGNRNEVAKRTQKIIQDTLNGYHSGISIKQAIIQNATVHPDVSEAYEDVVAATQDAERFQNEANIYRNDIVPKARGQAVTITQQAEGYKESVVAKAQGEASRFDALIAATGDNKDITRQRLYIETMEEVMGKAQKIIVDKAAGSGVIPYLPLNDLKPAAGSSSPDTDDDAVTTTAAPPATPARANTFGVK